MRRLLILLSFAACGGCRSAEITVNYPVAGVYVAAKFEAKDTVVAKPIVVATVTTASHEAQADAPTITR